MARGGSSSVLYLALPPAIVKLKMKIIASHARRKTVFFWPLLSFPKSILNSILKDFRINFRLSKKKIQIAKSAEVTKTKKSDNCSMLYWPETKFLLAIYSK